MASTSALRAQRTTSAQANNGQAWSDLEAATEVLKTAIAAISVSIDPGNVTVGTVTANAGTNLNTSLLALEAGGNLASIVADLGGLTETAPATDTASSALNGRLQRIAQRLTSLIALIAGGLPAALAAHGGLKIEGVASGVEVPVSGSITALSGTAANCKVAATLDAETTKVIGTINLAAAQTLAAITAITNPLPAGTNNIGKVSPPSGTLVNSSSYEASHVLKASAGTLTYLSGYNSGPAQFIQLFNSATVPANDSVPVKVIAVATQSNFSMDVAVSGMPFTTGISVSNSSVGPTKTIASNDVFFTAVVL